MGLHVQMTEAYRDVPRLDHSLKDRVGRARIQVRVDRLVHGNPRKPRVLTHEVCELKVDFGPEYCVYYTERAVGVIVPSSRWRQVVAAGEHQGRNCIG